MCQVIFFPLRGGVGIEVGQCPLCDAALELVLRVRGCVRVTSMAVRLIVVEGCGPCAEIRVPDVDVMILKRVG